MKNLIASKATTNATTLPYYQRRQIIHDNLRSSVQKEFQHLIHRSCKHRGNSQEERELGRSLTRHLLCHTADNRCHGTGHTRYHRNTLEQTDIKGFLLRQNGILTVFREYLVTEQA